jgi:hypothetical protein
MCLQQGRPSRWRPDDRDAHREAWTGPSSTESDRPTNNLSQYGKPDYVCGKTKIPFVMSELPDHPLPHQERIAEMDGRASIRTTGDRSNLQVRRASTKNWPRRRNDSGSEETTSASRRQNGQSNPYRIVRGGDRPNSPISTEERATMGDPRPVASPDMPNISSTEPDRAQSETGRRRQTRSLSDSTSSSDHDLTTFVPELSLNVTRISDSLREDVDSNRHRVLTKSTSTQQYPPRRQSSEQKGRDQDRSQNDPPRAARPSRHSSLSGQRDEGGPEQQAPPSLSAHHPPISERRRRRR